MRISPSGLDYVETSDFAVVEAAVWFRLFVGERVEVARLLRLMSWVHPRTKTVGQTPSHKGQWEAKKQLTYLVYVLFLKTSLQFVFPLVTCLVAFGHLKMPVHVSWAQKYQSPLWFSSTKRTHRVHMKTSPKHTQCLQITVPFSSWGEAGEGGCPADMWQFAVMLRDAVLLCCYSRGNNNNHLTHHPAWRMPELCCTGISRLYTCWIIVLSLDSRSGMWASAILRTASLEQKIQLKRET